VELRAGNKTITLSNQQLALLQKDANSKDLDALDAILTEPSGAKLPSLFVRLDAPPSAQAKQGPSQGEAFDPQKLVGALASRFGSRKVVVYGVTSLERAQANLERQTPVKGLQDIVHIKAGNLPSRADEQAVAAALKPFRQASPKPTPSDEQTILVVTAHNDAELWRDLQQRGEAGQLKGKYLLLNTCTAHPNAANFSQIIERHGAIGVLNHGKPILPEVLRPVLESLADIVKNAPSEGIPPAELFRRSVERAKSGEKSRLLTPRVKKMLDDLSYSFVQLSYDELLAGLDGKGHA
jgi:hypothetical protein